MKYVFHSLIYMLVILLALSASQNISQPVYEHSAPKSEVEIIPRLVSLNSQYKSITHLPYLNNGQFRYQTYSADQNGQQLLPLRQTVQFEQKEQRLPHTQNKQYLPRGQIFELEQIKQNLNFEQNRKGPIPNQFNQFALNRQPTQFLPRERFTAEQRNPFIPEYNRQFVQNVQQKGQIFSGQSGLKFTGIPLTEQNHSSKQLQNFSLSSNQWRHQNRPSDFLQTNNFNEYTQAHITGMNTNNPARIYNYNDRSYRSLPMILTSSGQQIFRIRDIVNNSRSNPISTGPNSGIDKYPLDSYDNIVAKNTSITLLPEFDTNSSSSNFNKKIDHDIVGSLLQMYRQQLPFVEQHHPVDILNVHENIVQRIGNNSQYNDKKINNDENIIKKFQNLPNLSQIIDETILNSSKQHHQLREKVNFLNNDNNKYLNNNNNNNSNINNYNNNTFNKIVQPLSQDIASKSEFINQRLNRNNYLTSFNVKNPEKFISHVQFPTSNEERNFNQPQAHISSTTLQKSFLEQNNNFLHSISSTKTPSMPNYSQIKVTNNDHYKFNRYPPSLSSNLYLPSAPLYINPYNPFLRYL